jgi:hypothetical protein
MGKVEEVEVTLVGGINKALTKALNLALMRLASFKEVERQQAESEK